jgi:hypothetical protein
MIESGCNIEEQNTIGHTLLMHLSTIHHYHSMEPLLNANASLSTIDEHGLTPLHLAVSYENEHNIELVIETCKILLLFGAMPNSRDHQLNTPLHLTKNPTVACSLITYGARLDLKNVNNIKSGGYFEELYNKGMKEPYLQLKESLKSFNERPDIVNVTTLSKNATDWLHDEMSDNCFLCAQQFTVTTRR